MFALYSTVALTLFFGMRCDDGQLPDYIKPCDYKKDFENCMKTQIEEVLPKFAKGVPELNITSLDPTHLHDINIDTNGLNLSFTEPNMHGLSQSKLINFTINLKKGQEKFSLSFKSNLSLTSQYVVDGRILILPIQGKGDALVDAQGVEVKIDADLIVTEDEAGKKRVKLSTPKYKYTIEKTVFDLKNLFNGNKQLADTTLQFANENWQQLMDELSPPVIKQIVKQVIKVINKFFSKVTIDQIILGYDE